jgi:hypothetical protein
MDALGEAEQHLGVEARPARRRSDATDHTTQSLYDWRTSPGNALLTLILLEFGDFPMTRKLLLGVKRRAEQLATTLPAAGYANNEVGYSPSGWEAPSTMRDHSASARSGVTTGQRRSVVRLTLRQQRGYRDGYVILSARLLAVDDHRPRLLAARARRRAGRCGQTEPPPQLVPTPAATIIGRC